MRATPAFCVTVSDQAAIPLRASYSISLLRLAATFGPGGAPAYVLDLTPIYRQLPRAARLGLDPRLASWLGVPEATQGDQAPPSPPSSPTGPTEWHITSDATGAPAWEAQLFGEHTEPCALAACNLPLLRWHRVYALGNHVEWTPMGLHLMTPPRGTVSAVFPEEVKEKDVEKAANGQRFYDYEAANTITHANNGSATSPRFRYPLLVTRVDETVSASPEGISYAVATNLGMTGRLGWLGVSATGYGGGIQGMLFITEGLVTLEIMAVVEPAALEGIWNDSAAIQPGALERMDPAHSQDLDEAVVFWGLWGDIDSQQGLSPPGLSGVGSAEVPLSQLGVPRLQDAVPNHPLVHWSSMDEAASFPLSSSLIEDLEEVGPGFRSSHLAMAIRSWEVLVEASAYGSTALSYDLALWEPGGFARWPGVVKVIAEEIADDLSRESVLLIPGGCLRPHRSIVDFMLCRYVHCVN